jgi:hypothetical protein
LEELGGGRGSTTHGEMYRTFLDELGLLVETGFVASRIEEPLFVRTFYDDFEAYCRNRSAVERKSILAIFELVDNADYASLYSGLVQYGFSEKSLSFFKIHAEASHWEDSRGEMEQYWSKEDRSLIIGAFEFLLQLQEGLYDGMHSWIVQSESRDDSTLRRPEREVLSLAANRAQ